MEPVNGFFGPYGGQFVPETLIPALDDLEEAFRRFSSARDEIERFHRYLHDYAGRPTALYRAERFSAEYGFELFLKREDLLHTGAHKINNTIGQALLTRFMGKKRVIAETGAGQHGVATATVAALFDLECAVYMGALDVERQAPNVARMKMLGAEVVPVTEGQGTLKEAINRALKDWVSSFRDTHYLLGTVAGPHPFPEMVGFFQSVTGQEARVQTLDDLPDVVVACVGGGSNAAGIFHGFYEEEVRLVGVEAGGRGDSPGDHAASLTLGRPGIFQGARSYLLQNGAGQVDEAHSVSAGLDYPGIGPVHSWLRDQGRVDFVRASDEQALAAFYELVRLEGIFPALESSHALGWAMRAKNELAGKRVLVNLSGRGDKDFGIIQSLEASK
jgi:tryptophan synthase beta chain